MAHVSDKSLDEFVDLSRKHGIVYNNRGEAQESANNLVGLAEVLIETYQEEQIRKKRLDKEKSGFPFPGEGRGCSLCKQHIAGDMWYDKWGQKCLDCHEAFKKKIIPGYVFKDRDNEKHITSDKLQWKYDVRSQTVKKLVRQSKLKARVIKGNGVIVFLKKENPDLVKVIEEDRKTRVRLS